MTLAEAVARATRMGSPRRYTPTEGQGPTFDPPGATPPPEVPPAEEPAEEEEEEEEAESTRECPHCGTDEPESRFGNMARNEGGDEIDVCDDCWSNDFTGCDACGEQYPDDSLTEAQGRRRRFGTVSVCPQCLESGFSRCADCGSHYDDEQEDRGVNASDEGVCHNCAEDYFTCDDCNNTFHTDDYGSEGRCEDCSREDEDEDWVDSSKLIHGYNYKPEVKFLGDPKERHFGVEVEAVQKQGSVNDSARHMLERLNAGLEPEGFAYLKYDRSVADRARAMGSPGGFEIVTHAATLDTHKQRWPNALGPNAPKGLISHDAGTGIGLHVHVERTGLSTLTIAKMLGFVHSRANRPYLEALARRPNSRQWAHMIDDKKMSDAGKPTDDRYQALNLKPKDTLEFRIFRGTLNQESLFRTLEFCDAVTEFAKPARHSMADVRDIRPFFAFVARHAKRYPLLAKFNAEFLGKHPPPPPDHLRMNRRAEPVSRGVKMSVVLRFEPPRRPANPWAAAVARAIGGR